MISWNGRQAPFLVWEQSIAPLIAEAMPHDQIGGAHRAAGLRQVRRHRMRLDLEAEPFEQCLGARRVRRGRWAEPEAAPPPNAVLSTSLSKCQIFWRVDGFTVEKQESGLKLLAITFGGDPGCTDCNRVLRLPGFLNCKSIRRTPSPSITPAIPLGSPMISGCICWRRMPCFRPVQSDRESIPVSTAIPSAIGHGFCMN
jgi:hypothetical protein